MDITRSTSNKRSWLGRLRTAACSLALAAVFLLAAASCSFAADTQPQPGSSVKLSFLPADIVIDGKITDNYFMKVPVTVDEAGNVYLPASQEMLSALGLELRITKGSGASSAGAEGTGFDDWLKAVGAKYRDGVISGVGADVMEIRASGSKAYTFGRTLNHNLVYDDTATAYDYIVVGCESFAPAGTSPLDIVTGHAASEGRKIAGFAGENIFLVNANGFIYIPITLFQNADEFGISIYYSRYDGLYISTDPSIDASRYVNSANLSFIRGVAQWINSVRTEFTPQEARHYEYLFRHEANVNGIDELMIIGVATTESHMTASAIGGGGATGMMQTLARYARNYGYSYDMLLTPHYSIELGAMYLRDRYWTFNGDLVRTLAAYNRGTHAVLTGNYNTVYANKVLGYRNQILNYLKDRGCATAIQNSYAPKAK